MWPRSRLSSSSSPQLPPSLSVESLSGPSTSSHLKLRPGYGIRGSLSRCLYVFPVRLLVHPASEPRHTGPSDGRLAARLPSQSTMPSSTKRESLCLLRVPTMSELIRAKYSLRTEAGGLWLRDPAAAPRLRPHPSVSVQSSPVAPLSPGPPLMVII